MQGWFSKLEFLLRIIFPVVLLIFIIRFIAADWIRFREALSSSSVLLMTLSLVGFTGTTLTLALAWHFVLHILGGKITVLQSMRSYFLSILGKYIPGKIWGTAGRIYLAKKEGIPEGTALLGIIMETMMLIISASVVGGLAITQWTGSLSWKIRYLPLFAMASIILLHPGILHRIILLFTRRFPSRMLSVSRLPDIRTLLCLLSVYCGIWIWSGIGFFFAVISMVELPVEYSVLEHVVPLIGCNTLAWLTGFLVVISPAGLGVRELVLMSLMAGSVGTGRAALAAVISRIFILISEAIGTLVFIWKRKNDNHLDQEEPNC